VKHVDHQIQAYCDGELSPSLREAFEAHVRRCAPCRRELEATQALWAEVDAARPTPDGPAAWPGVQARLARRAGRTPWTWPQRGLAVAAVVAGVVLGFELGQLGAPGTAADDLAEADYLEESLPSLDQLWLQLGDSDEDTGS
jgi:anti-sigma factor RsiW